MPALGLVADQRQRAPIRLGGLRVAPQPALQLGARGGEQVIAVELAALVELIHELETALERTRHRDRHRAVERDHRRGMHARQDPVERGDLNPVGVGGRARLGVHRRDRRLEHVRAGRPAALAQGGLDQGRAFLDLRAVPARAVLLGEQHDVARSVQPGLAPRVVEQHEGEEALGLGMRRQQLDQHAPEPDGLLGELVPNQTLTEARGIALVEDEIHHHQHRVEPLGQGLGGRHLVGDARVADLGLGAHEPLRHGRRRHQEGARDFLGRKPTERAQREGHLRLRRERGMAAREDQAEPVLGHGRLLVTSQQRSRQLDVPRDLFLLLLEPGTPAQPVDRLVPSGGDQPAHRIRRGTGRRPLPQPRRECLLERLLGHVDVAEQAYQRGQDPTVLRAKDLLDAHGRSRWEGYPTGRPRARDARYFGGPTLMGRTSIERPAFTNGWRVAKASASSRSLASTMV